GEEFSRLRGVVSVAVVTGRFDLILVVLLKEGFGLLEFYTEDVARLEGVQSVETFVVYKGYHLKVPYIL
ncbi:MAG: Lrp/AsnC ligand binding domain-containing protein, partial [Desulfobacteraceae bacterium]|nr:Lrp/AsnC ligand binding domain-containing protein [Desulfobacteraceae bacterium]